MNTLLSTPQSALPPLNVVRKGPLPWLLGMACAVIVVAGLRAASGILNPMLMAGFHALLFQPMTHRLRRWGMAGGLAVTLVVLAVVLGGLLLVAFVGVSLRQLTTCLTTSRHSAGGPEPRTVDDEPTNVTLVTASVPADRFRDAGGIPAHHGMEPISVVCTGLAPIVQLRTG